MRANYCYALVCGIVAMIVSCGDSKREPLWPLDGQQECEGETISALGGSYSVIMSQLEVGTLEDGFDLDGDGAPDNKLSGLSQLAQRPIEEAFERYEVLVPMEFFDLDTVGPDECFKMAIYYGNYQFDRDQDTFLTSEDRANEADCNDTDDAVYAGAEEIVGNFYDDDCDGIADEVWSEDMQMDIPSADTLDRDEDGVTIADGDCDDLNPATRPGAVEICGDGLDNDCDGRADFGFDSDSVQYCTPFDASPDLIGLDPIAFDSTGAPIVTFKSGRIFENDGRTSFEAGPSIFAVTLPVIDGVSLDLRISGAQMHGDLVETADGLQIENGRLAGVLDAFTIDTIVGFDVPEIGLKPEDSLLDATFASILGPILGLPQLPIDHPYSDCRTPDIDVDQDGLEAFCDTNPSDSVKVVDLCIDGDGTEVRDVLDGDGNVIMHCTEAVDSNGDRRFVDGISVELNFEAVPTVLPASL